MKAALSAAALASASAWISRIVPARPPSPVMAGVVIEATSDVDRDEVSLAAFDYETSGCARLGDGVMTVDEPGRVVVSGRLLATLAKTIGSGEQVVTLAADGSTLAISVGKSRWSMPLLAVEDYPRLPDLGPKVGELPTAALVSAVGAVGDACDEKNEVGLQALTGMAVVAEPDGPLTMVGTNRYQISVCETSWTAADGELEQQLPPASLMRFAAAAVSGTDGPVTVHAGNGTLGFSTPERWVSGRLLGAEFVRWRTLDATPEKGGTWAATSVVALAQLREALARAVVMLESDRSWVRMDWSVDGVEMSTVGEGTGEAQHVADVVSYDGDPITIGANAAYLRDALDGAGTWGATHARVDLCAPHRPMLFRPCDPAGAILPGYRHSVMPVRVPSAEETAA